MFSYFEENYIWSSTVNLALMAGGDLGQIDHFLQPLRQKTNAAAADWANAWDAMAKHQASLAAQYIADDHHQDASSRYLRAGIYAPSSERRMPPGSQKSVPLVVFYNGFDVTKEALERVETFMLEEVLPKLTRPFLMLHGEADPIPVTDAEKIVEAAGSMVKTLRVFSREEGGAEHVGADDPDPNRQLMTVWFLEKL